MKLKEWKIWKERGDKEKGRVGDRVARLNLWCPRDERKAVGKGRGSVEDDEGGGTGQENRDTCHGLCCLSGTAPLFSFFKII